MFHPVPEMNFPSFVSAVLLRGLMVVYNSLNIFISICTELCFHLFCNKACFLGTVKSKIYHKAKTLWILYSTKTAKNTWKWIWLGSEIDWCLMEKVDLLYQTIQRKNKAFGNWDFDNIVLLPCILKWTDEIFLLGNMWARGKGITWITIRILLFLFPFHQQYLKYSISAGNHPCLQWSLILYPQNPMIL